MTDKKEGLSVLATELVLNPDIVVVVNGYQAAAVKESTKTVPIVTMAAGDLVAEGLVANLAHHRLSSHAPLKRSLQEAGMLRFLWWRRIRRLICRILRHRVRQGYCYDCKRYRLLR
jgi:hypothetical protein